MPAIKKQYEETLVVAFDSTASALAFEVAAKSVGLEGRLFPIPRSLSAGCGIAWREDPQHQELVEEVITAEEIDDAQVVIMPLRLG